MWQSPGTMSVPAQRFGGWYQEIPTVAALPRNDSFFNTKAPIDFYLQFAKEWGILGYIASDIKPLAA